MAEQVIIEFVGDSTKFEEAYHRVEETVKEGTQVSQESLQQFQKANADAAASAEKLSGSAKTVSDSFREMNKTISSGAMKEVAKDMQEYTDKVSALAAKHKDVAEKLKEVTKQLDALKEAGKKASEPFAQQSAAIKKLAGEQKGLNKNISDLGKQSQAAMKEAAGMLNEMAKGSAKSASAFDKQNKSVKELEEKQKSLTVEMAAMGQKSEAGLRQAAQALRDMAASSKDGGKAFIKQAENLEHLADKQQGLTEKVTEMGSKSVETFGKVAGTLDKASEAGKKGAAAFGEQSAKIKGLAVEQKELTTAVTNLGKQSVKALTDAAHTLDGAATSSAKLKAEQKNLAAQMAELSEKGSKAMEGLGKGLKKTSESVESLKKSFSAAGVSSDVFETATKKLNQAISVTNTLGETSKSVSEALSALKKTETAAREANALATGGEAAAETGATAAKTTSTAAQWLLNAAMAANPVLAIVAGVAALVVGLKALFSSTKDTTEEQKKKNEADKEALETTKQRMEIEKQQSDEQTAGTQRRIEDLKAQKAPVEEIRKAENQLAQDRIDAAKKQEQALGKQLEDFKQHKEERIQQQRDLNDQIRKLQEDLAKDSDNEKLKKQLEVTKQQYENLTDTIKVCGDAIKETDEAAHNQVMTNLEHERQQREEGVQSAIAGFRLKAAQAVQGSKQELDANIQVLKAEADAQKAALANDASAGAQRALIDAETNKKIAEMRNQFRLKNLEDAKAAYDEQHKRAQQGSQEELQMKLKDLEFEANIEKEKVGNVANRAEKIKEIEERLRADTEKAQKEFDAQRVRDADAVAVAIAQSEVNVAKKNSQEEYLAKLKLIDAERTAEINAATQTIKDTEQLAARIKEINTTAERQQQEAKDVIRQQAISTEQKQLDDAQARAKTAMENVLNNVKSTAQQKIDAENAYNAVVEGNDNKQLDFYRDLLSKKMISADEFTAKEMELSDKKAKRDIENSNKVAAQEKKNKDQQMKDDQAVAQAAIKVAQQASDAIFAAANAARNAKFNAELSSLEKQSQAELNNHNLTATQKAAIEKKFHAQEAAIKLKQWKADQKSKEIQAGINGALAIANILATMPWSDFGVGQAIAIAMSVATTAIQVATIASAKPPQFAKGTPKGMPDAPPGLIWVGEKGPELMYNKGAGRVITNADSMKLMEKYDIPAMPNYTTTLNTPVLQDGLRQLMGSEYANSTAIDYDKLGHVIAEKLKANPQTHLHFDKTGFAMHLVKQGNKVTSLNNRYSS